MPKYKVRWTQTETHTFEKIYDAVDEDDANQKWCDDQYPHQHSRHIDDNIEEEDVDEVTLVEEKS